MRKIAIFKIISFSCILFILIGVLVWGMFHKSNGFSLGFTNFRYANASAYSVAKEKVSVEAEEINKVEVNWLGGGITIHKSEDNQIHFYEIYDDQIKEDEDNFIRYLIEDRKLTIQFCKSTWHVKRNVARGKELILQLPSEILNEMKIHSVSANISYQNVDLTTSGLLKIESVSGNCEISNASFNELKFDNVSGKVDLKTLNCKSKINVNTVSGDVKLYNVIANDLNVDSVSGSIVAIGSLSMVNLNTVSGEVKLTLDHLPSQLDCETVSGDITIKIPDNDGFKVSFDTVSGDLSTNFEASISKKEIIYKNGGTNFDFETVSGDLKIEMNVGLN